MQKYAIKILGLLEKYTKVDMVYFVEGGFWVFLGQIASSLIALGLAVAFANLVPKETYGQYKYVLSLAGIVGAFSLSGMAAAVIQAIARGFDKTLPQAFWLNLKWGMLITVISLSASAYYFFAGNFFLFYSLLIIAFFLPFLLSAQLYSAFWNGKKDFQKKTLYEMAQNIITPIFILGAIFFTDNPLPIVFVYFSVHTLTALVLYTSTLKKVNAASSADENMGTYSKHLSFMNMLEIVSGNIDKILVFNFLGALELARYAFAIAIPDQTKPFLKGLNSLILPRFSEREERSIRFNMGKKILLLFFFNLLLVLVYIPLAPFIYKIFFPQYQEVVYLSQIFSLSLLAGSYTPIEIYFVAKKKIRVQYIIRTIVSLFQIAVVAGFVIWWGLFGLVLARVAARFFSTFVNLFYYYVLAPPIESET